MQWWISAYRFVEALRLTLLVEEAILVALCDKEIKLEIASRKLHTASDRCPFAKADRLVFYGTISQRITADDILLQHITEREEIRFLSHLFEMLTVFVRLFHHTALRLYGVNCTVCVQPLRGWVLGEDIFFESYATGLGVVGQEVDAVAGAYGN